MRSFFVLFVALGTIIITSSFVAKEDFLPSDPCLPNVAVSNFVIADAVTIEAIGEIWSAQSILENSNVIYRSESGTVLSFSSMTGSLTGPSPNFQIFSGSTLTVEIDNCSN